MAEERFFMDHGMWHDRETGQHLYTEDQHRAELNALSDEAWGALTAAGIPRDGVRSLGESISKLARGARVDAKDDEAFQQFQRDRIEAARKHDAEQAKPKLTPAAQEDAHPSTGGMPIHGGRDAQR